MGNKSLWAGRILSGIIGALMLFVGISVIFLRTPDTIASFAMFGYPASALTPVGVSALIAGILYLIPRTAPLGAIILTGYFGGAVATHVRISDPAWVMPVFAGILVWLGLWLRDARLRALLPLS